uniref:phenylacetaldoxime dehydratase family protein n=1 Tax=Ningiella ruwaisensis TaxID=2364274 RepID=UPI001444AD22|nr:phenylacetaldoxime dehydratase family protein [Ningiella ruwaisensis]
MNKQNMPTGWEPPAPAWKALWKVSDQQAYSSLTAGYFGIQGNDHSLLSVWAQDAFTSQHAPKLLERARYIDQHGLTNFVFIAYWEAGEYQKWWQDHSLWWQQDAIVDHGIGLWREIIQMPYERFETLHSSQKTHGVSKIAENIEGPIQNHGYAGSARDRIPISASDNLKSKVTISELLSKKVSNKGKRVQINPPGNMCVIRSGQNWSNCVGEQKDYYLNELQPALLAGMNYLRENPIESTCYVMRFMTSCDEQWNEVEETFGLGYGIDIYTFETWAKSHPTHIDIFSKFISMAETFGEKLSLQLWHEVIVLAEAGCECEYINCHSETGLMRYG